jgi:hypothetical protein
MHSHSSLGFGCRGSTTNLGPGGGDALPECRRGGGVDRESSLQRQGGEGFRGRPQGGATVPLTQPKTDTGGGVREPESLKRIQGEGYQQIWRPPPLGLGLWRTPSKHRNALCAI